MEARQRPEETRFIHRTAWRRPVPTTISGVPTEVFVESILAKLGSLLWPLHAYLGSIKALATDMDLTDEERGARLRRLFADEPEPRE
jgi:hypothetical protein